MPLYVGTIVGVNMQSGNTVGCYLHIARQASSLEVAIGIITRAGHEQFPQHTFLTPIVVEISREMMLEELAWQGIQLTYDRDVVQSLIVDALEANGPEGRNTYKDRQLVRIAHALGLELNPGGEGKVGETGDGAESRTTHKQE